MFASVLATLLERLEWQKQLFNSFMTEVPARNQSVDLSSKSMDWFLYGRDLRHERVKLTQNKIAMALLVFFY